MWPRSSKPSPTTSTDLRRRFELCALVRAADREGSGNRLLHRFTGIAGAIEVLEFAPLSFVANDSEVMVLLRFRSRAQASGKGAAMHLHHYWRFRDGKVSSTAARRTPS